MENLEEKINLIKNWLGTGSINIFGLPMSGKDTVGIRLAELLNAKFLSSGLIIRTKEKEVRKDYTSKGNLAPTNVFFDLVLPYFYRDDLKEYSLVLSSVGRWSGEEDEILRACEESNHPTRVVILLNISESDVMNRWENSRVLQDRGERQDDKDKKVFENRCNEFREKTMPVILHYRSLGLLTEINADQSRDEVLAEVVDKLYNLAKAQN